MSHAIDAFEVPGDAPWPMIVVICDDPQAPLFQTSVAIAQEALQLPGTVSDSVSRSDGRLDSNDIGLPPQTFEALLTIDAGQWRLFTVAAVRAGPCSGLVALGMGSNQVRLKRASNLALAFCALRFGPLAPRSDQLQSLDQAMRFRNLTQTSHGAAAVREESPPPPPPLHPPPRTRPPAHMTDPAPQPPSQPLPQHKPPPDAGQVPVPVFCPAVGTSGCDVAPSHAGIGSQTSASIGSTQDDSSVSVDDLKLRLVVWRRQQPRLERCLLHAVRQLVQRPSAYHAVCEDVLEPEDAEVFQDLQAVLEGDTWKGISVGKDWVHAWLKWGEPFDIEDPAACGKAIGGKTEQKQRQNWSWYFGSAPWLQALVVSHACAARASLNNTSVVHPSKLSGLPAPSLPVATVAPSDDKDFAPSIGTVTSSDPGGVWDFETGACWKRFPPEQSARLEEAWKHDHHIVVFNAGWEYEFEVDLVAMHQTMLGTGAVWKVRRQVARPAPENSCLQQQCVAEDSFAGSRIAQLVAANSSLQQASVTAGLSSGSRAPFLCPDAPDACQPTLPESDSNNVFSNAIVPDIPEGAELIAEPPACLHRVFPEPDRDEVLRGLSRNDREDAVTVRTVGSTDSIPLGTDLDTGFYCNLWAASRVNDPAAGLVLQCNRGMRVIDAENVGFSYGEAFLHKQVWQREGVRRAVQHFLQEGLHVILVTPRRHLKDMAEEGVDIIIAENSNSTDDVQVLKQAHAHNCPWVSRDGANDWKKDWRLSSELRQWVQTYSFLQVRWSWGPRGDFIPDFDFSIPALRPSSGADGSCCHWCKGTAAGDGEWLQWWGDWYWACQQCCQQWGR